MTSEQIVERVRQLQEELRKRPIEGVFDAKAADDILSGQMTIPAAQGSNQAAFRLTVEASDGPPPARDGAPTPACNNLLDLMGPKGDTGMSAACGGRG